MIDTVIFDMGGTLEDIWVSEESKLAAATEVLNILKKFNIATPISDVSEAFQELHNGWQRYSKYKFETDRELKPEEIWGNYILNDKFGLDFNKVKNIAEELSYIWEKTYFHRELRPGVHEMLEGLKSLGMKLGVMSNTSSLFGVFSVLKQHKLRNYFQDITLSSITGYRKPDPHIFWISLNQLQSLPSTSAYVGDTLSRDVVGPQKVGFAMTFHINSHLTEQSNSNNHFDGIRPTYSIKNIGEVYTILKNLKENNA